MIKGGGVFHWCHRILNWQLWHVSLLDLMIDGVRINILKRERRHIIIEKQKQIDDLACTMTSISYPNAVSENKHENYCAYGRETWGKTYKSFLKFIQRKGIFTILNNPWPWMAIVILNFYSSGLMSLDKTKRSYMRKI